MLFVCQFQSRLRNKGYLSICHFEFDTLLIDRFEEATPFFPVDLEHRTHDVGKRPKNYICRSFFRWSAISQRLSGFLVSH